MKSTGITSNEEANNWDIDIEPVPTFDVPRFIRLFLIRRIIIDYISKTASPRSNDDTMSQLVSTLKDKDTRTTADKILSRLVKDGIKVYMSKWYNEKQDAIVIETIFTDIILIKFGKKYQQLTTYVGNDEFEAQTSVFNNDDLMRLIFQYLTFRKIGFVGELNDCSLVNSYWLYHIWSTKLIYGKYYLTNFIKATIEFNCNSSSNCNELQSKSSSSGSDSINNSVIRSWDRLVKLKNVDLKLRYVKNDVCNLEKH